MFAKTFLIERLSNWTKLLEETHGFPVDPETDQCWIWTGSHSTAGTYGTMVKRAPDKPMSFEVRHNKPEPRAKFLGHLVSPHRVMVAFHNDLDIQDVGRLANTCGSRSCINPLHWTKVGEAPSPRTLYPPRLPPTEPEPVPEPDERQRAFKVFFDAAVSIVDTPLALKHRVFNEYFIETYLAEYQDHIRNKTLAEIAEEFET